MTSFARWLSLAVVTLCLAGLTVRAQDTKEGTIKGQAVTRDNGKYFGIDVSGGTFAITFYNEHKKPEKTEITKAVLHWPVHYQPNEERTLLTPNADGVLTSEKPVRAPHTFKLYIAFFVDGKDDPVEQYVVDFAQ